MLLVETVCGMVCAPFGDGSNPKWGRTGYHIEGSRDLFKSGYNVVYRDPRYKFMRPELLVIEERCRAR